MTAYSAKSKTRRRIACAFTRATGGRSPPSPTSRTPPRPRHAVCPGMIDTELTRENAPPELLDRLAASYPVPRLGTAREVADLICFAASEEAGYITGASLDINGGDLMM